MSDSKMLFVGKGFEPSNPAHVARVLKLTGDLPAPLPGDRWTEPAAVPTNG